MKKIHLVIAIAAAMMLSALGVPARAAPDVTNLTVYTINVPSTVPWTDTGINIAAGSQLEITATGIVHYSISSYQVCDANGGDYTGAQFLSDMMLSNTVCHSLVGKIGGTTNIGTGTLVPEGTPGDGPGFVGTNYSEVISNSGEFFLGFNDNPTVFWDNSGSFSVTISVVPPSPIPVCAGEIVAWGQNYQGECNVPSPNTGFTAIAAGSQHWLGLKADGSILAWGDNTWGECNVPSPNTNFIAVAAGNYHSLGLKADGSIVAWGFHTNGDPRLTVPSPNSGFIAIAAGNGNLLGLKTNGSIVAWGDNYSGECNVPSPNTGFTAIAAGGYHSLGLKADGSVVAWGNNEYGQSTVPSPNTGFIAIAAGWDHSLGLKTNGSIVAWGNNQDYWGNYSGQCDVPSPNIGFAAIAAGWSHSLGLKNDGSIVAWGYNAYGECNVPSPNTGFTAISAGGGYFSLGLKCLSSTSCDPAPSGLVGWWRAEGNANDSSGNGNNGILQNVGFTNGVVGQAFAFDPETFYPTRIQIADQPVFQLTNALSIECWVRPRGDGYGILWRGDSRWGFDPYRLSMQNNNTVAFDITDQSNNTAAVYATLVYNQWWHVAGTWDGNSGEMKLYVNGALVSQTTTTIRPIGALIPADDPALCIGNDNRESDFAYYGDIDEVSLYSRALSQSEIQAIYNAGSSGKCVPATGVPIITSQPTNQIVAMCGTATFAVEAGGAPPLSYQWNFNGTNLAAATNATLTLSNVQLAQAGSYAVLVTNALGSVLSSNALLTVNLPLPVSITCPSNITVTACPSGAVVNYTVTVSGGCPPYATNCEPPSGSIFPIGTTTVNCSAMDSYGQSNNCSFTVTVLSPPPLSITCPSNITVTACPGGAVVNYTVTIGGGLPPYATNCVPPSGSTFPMGTTTVSCTATDSCGQSNCCSFTVTVSPPPPLSITCPSNITVTACPGGAVVNYAVTVGGGLPPYTTNCVPPSGSVFPMGTTTVNCTATDSCGQSNSCSFTVTVSPPPPLSITCPGNITVMTTNPAGAVVNYPAPTVGGGLPPYTTNCVPPSGSIFPIGITTVNCSATDSCGQSANCSFTIAVGVDALLITPATGFTASGYVGGPFTTSLENFSLTNIGTATLNWSLVNTSLWLDASPNGGTLTPGGPATNVTVSLNSAASNLLVGTYTATIWFTNLSDSVGQSRQFTLAVVMNIAIDCDRDLGLRVFAQPNANYQRTEMVSQNSQMSWVSNSTAFHGYPVKYSFTVTNLPPMGDALQTMFWFIPVGAMPTANSATGANDTGLDVDATNALCMTLNNQGVTNDNYHVFVGYKLSTNGLSLNLGDPGVDYYNSLGNHVLFKKLAINYYNGKNPTGYGAASGNGTWTLTFSDANHGSVTGPGLSPVSFTIPAGDEQYFLNPLQVYFGVQNNSTFSIGDSVLCLNISIRGPQGTNMDDFSNGKNWSDNWRAVEAPGTHTTEIGLWAVPQNIACWLSWTTPSAGYDVEITPYLTPDPSLGYVPWVMPAYYNGFSPQLTEQLEGRKYWTFITTNVLDQMMVTYPNVVSNAFFRLHKPAKSSP